MSNRWIESATHKFVDLYVQHACLYNVKCPEYKNKQARDAALETIATEMHLENFGVKEAYAKIRSLRSTYSQELKKIKESTRSGASGNIYVPHMTWFKILDDALSAINVECRDTQSNLQSASDQPQTSNENSLQQLERISSQHQSPTLDEFIAPSPTTATRKRRIRELQSLIDKVDNITKTTSSPNTENEFDIFGKGVASQLKAMPLSLAIRAQQQIQNVLCDLRIQQLNNNDFSTPSIIRVNSPYSSSNYSRSPTPQQPITSPAASPTYQSYETENSIASPKASPTYQSSQTENGIASPPPVATENDIGSPASPPTNLPNTNISNLTEIDPLSPTHLIHAYEFAISDGNSSESQTLTLYASTYEEALELAVGHISK